MKILLATLHAKYVHASLALPCLAAACSHIAGVTTKICEFTVHEPSRQILRSLVEAEADLVGFSCYIWNIQETLRLAADLKKIRPQTLVVLGGPEASFGVCEMLERNPAVDCVIRGEGEASFAGLVAAMAQTDGNDALLRMTEGITFRNGDELIVLPERSPLSNLDAIPSPFAARLTDLSKPLVYYETSRGCPFSCAFCMSSLERGVRSFSPSRIEQDLLILMEQRVRTVKLVDRTFNFDPARANRIWEFILRHNVDSTFHFEIAADLLSDENLRVLSRVPPGLFRFEIGVQSENQETLARVGRKNDLGLLLFNVARLRDETGVVLHLDLVAGLPFENFTGFLCSLQTLLQVRPHHIQVEPLKVLKGSPMRRIAAEEGYSYSDHPPYQILTTPWLSFSETGRIETISRLLELFYNSGVFSATLGLIANYMELADFFSQFANHWETEQLTGSMSQQALFEVLGKFLASSRSPEQLEPLRDSLRFDYCKSEYPVSGKLPSFFPQGALPAGLPRRDELFSLLPLPANARVRTFLYDFSRDHRQKPPVEGEVRLLFVYVSTTGKKMQVHVLRR